MDVDNMIIKNFLRKKKTYVYIALVIINLIIITLLGVLREEKIQNANIFFDQAHIEFRASSSDYNKINDIKNINRITLGVVTNFNNETGVKLMQDETNSLKENELIGAPRIFADYNIGDTINFPRIDYDFTLKEIEFYDFELNYINPNTFLEVTTNYNEYLYYVYLKDWSKLDNTLDILKYEGISYRILRGNYDLTNSRPSYINYYLLNTLFVAIFLLIVIYLIINILYRDTEKEYLYQALGFTKRKLGFIRIVKFLLVCLIGIGIYGFFYLIVSIF